MIHFRSVEKYNATLGHILNHSPKPNAWYGMLDHPRSVNFTNFKKLDHLTNRNIIFHYFKIVHFY